MSHITYDAAANHVCSILEYARTAGLLRSGSLHLVCMSALQLRALDQRELGTANCKITPQLGKGAGCNLVRAKGGAEKEKKTEKNWSRGTR